MTVLLDPPETLPLDDLVHGKVADVTRRQFVAGGLAVGAILLTGCGQGGDGDSASAVETRRIDHALGSTDVPADPRRIVALDAYATLQVLDEIAAPVVAAGSLGGDVRVLVSDGAAALPSIGVTTELNLEAVAAANPDLIVGLEWIASDFYDELSAIAPTVVIRQSDDWREILRAVAAAVGRADAAEERLAQVAERTAELRAAVARSWPDGVRVSLLRVVDAGGGALSYTSASTGGFIYAQIFTDLGLTVPADEISPDGAAGGNVELSAERLSQADADVILYYAGGGASSGEEVAELTGALTDSPLWSRLSAVRAGRAHQVEAGPWFDGGDTEAANRVLDDLFTHLTTP